MLDARRYDSAVDWMVLKGGFPREPEHGNWDELASLPGPPRFFEALFREVAGDFTWSGSVQLESEKDDELETRSFLCGTAVLGCRVTERVVLVSSDFPISVAVATHGLDGLEVRWDYALPYQGQLGHCGFRHRWLSVSYADSAALARFEATWRAVFGHAPVLGPPAESSGGT